MSNPLQELHSLFKTCLDILRNDAEHLIGDEALNELSHLLILKQTEKHIVNGSIDIYNKKYYKDGISRYGEQQFFEYLEYVKFSKLYEYVKIPEKEGNIKNIFDEFLWKEVLSNHPKFKDVFESGTKTFIRESTTIKKLIIALNSIDFNQYEYDILGEAYEKIFVDAVFGAGGNKKSELGQFFTPPKIKKLLIQLVHPIIKENGEIESVLDPASGTGGILNTVIKHFKQFEKTNQISKDELRKQLIKHIYGIEIKGKIYNLCLSNMLINTGEILPNVICADSIRQFHNLKVDNIIANPPFSVTINYDELLSSLESVDILNDYIPIKTGGKNSEVLFLQMMIHCLHINGRCATVMLDGQKMYGASSGYDLVRQYLMKSCDLHEVIYCPSGTFTSTSSKTCILFFTKRKERKDMVEITGIKRNLQFSNEHSTKAVRFYEFNPDTEDKSFIIEVSIDDIASKRYSLNYNDYIVEHKDLISNQLIDIVELGDICDIVKGMKRKSKDGYSTGLYPLYYCSILGHLYLNTYDYTDEGIILNKTNGSGKAMIYYGHQKYNVGESTIHFKSKSDKIKTKYIYYYLYHNIPLIEKYFKGANQKSIVEKDLFKIQIPIPSTEQQINIVNHLDKLSQQYDLHDVMEYYKDDLFKIVINQKYELYTKFVEWKHQSDELENQIKLINDRQSRYIYFVEQIEKNTTLLDNICNIVKGMKRKSKDGSSTGLYPLYYCSILGHLYLDSYDYTDEGIILNKTNGSGKAMIYYGHQKYNVGESTIHFKSKSDKIKTKYIYYYLYHNIPLIEKYFKGANQKSIVEKDLFKIQIPIPSFEKQNEIIHYCEQNEQTIKQFEKEIEQNKKQANLFLLSLINTNDF